MTYRRTLSGWLVLCVLAIAPTTSVIGQEPETLQVTIHPQAFPRPTLKYQLLPEFKDRVRGNAAVYYGKVTAEHLGFFGNMKLREKIDEWNAASLSDLLKPDVEMNSASIEKMLRMAARCESCDWQLPVREEEFYTMGLPEVQQLRQFARILLARMRIQIAHGKFDAAIETLQSALAIGKNAAEGETIVNGLVGVAIDSVMAKQILELIQQPGAPNLYWALSTLPRPLIDLRKGAEAEMSALELSFPVIRNLRAERTPEEWEAMHSKFWRQVVELVPFMEVGNGVQVKDLKVESLVAESFLHAPAGRQRLLDQGIDPVVVSAMPNAQVALIEAVRAYEIDRDNLFRWFLVPYDDGLQPGETLQHQADQEKDRRSKQGKLSQIFLPNLYPARRASAQLDRSIAVLRAIEALRMYAATHDGKLPAKLSEIVGAPVPVDPMTGKPIEYELRGEVGLIRVTPLTERTHTYEIHVAKP